MPAASAVPYEAGEISLAFLIRNLLLMAHSLIVLLTEGRPVLKGSRPNPEPLMLDHLTRARGWDRSEPTNKPMRVWDQLGIAIHWQD